MVPSAIIASAVLQVTMRFSMISPDSRFGSCHVNGGEQNPLVQDSGRRVESRERLQPSGHEPGFLRELARGAFCEGLPGFQRARRQFDQGLTDGRAVIPYQTDALIVQQRQQNDRIRMANNLSRVEHPGRIVIVAFHHAEALTTQENSVRVGAHFRFVVHQRTAS